MAKEEECRQCTKCKIGSYGTLKCSFYGRKPEFNEESCPKFIKGLSPIENKKKNETPVPKEPHVISYDNTEELKKNLKACRIAIILSWMALLLIFMFVTIGDIEPMVLCIVFITSLVIALIPIYFIDRKRKKLMSEEEIQKEDRRGRRVAIIGIIIIILMRLLLR